MNVVKYYLGSLYKVHLTSRYIMPVNIFEKKKNGAMKKSIQYLDFMK